MGLPTGRVNARSGRVCMFACANVHAPFLSKAPYWTPLFHNVRPNGYGLRFALYIPSMI